MATANFDIDAEDGWVAVTSAGVNFIKIRSNTRKHPFYVTTGSSTPAATVTGFKVTCEEFWCDTAITDNVYVRLGENIPQNTRIDVFYILT